MSHNDLVLIWLTIAIATFLLKGKQWLTFIPALIAGYVLAGGTVGGIGTSLSHVLNHASALI